MASKTVHVSPSEKLRARMHTDGKKSRLPSGEVLAPGSSERNTDRPAIRYKFLDDPYTVEMGHGAEKISCETRNTLAAPVGERHSGQLAGVNLAVTSEGHGSGDGIKAEYAAISGRTARVIVFPFGR